MPWSASRLQQAKLTAGKVDSQLALAQYFMPDEAIDRLPRSVFHASQVHRQRPALAEAPATHLEGLYELIFKADRSSGSQAGWSGMAYGVATVIK